MKGNEWLISDPDYLLEEQTITITVKNKWAKKDGSANDDNSDPGDNSDDQNNDNNQDTQTGDEKYSGNDYRAGIVKPQGGDDYMKDNFGTTGYEAPTQKTSTWNSNGDSLLPLDYERPDKNMRVEMDLNIDEAKKGHYLARIKILSWPETPSATNPIRAKVQFTDNITDTKKRLFNLNDVDNVNKFIIGQDYWIDISANMETRKMDTSGAVNVNDEVLYIYLHDANYSTGKMCIVTNAGGTWIRKGADWIAKP